MKTDKRGSLVVALLLAVLFLRGGEAPAQAPQPAQPSPRAEDVVQRQLDAYNARDLEAFAATYSDDIVVYRPPATTPSLSGKQELRAFYRDKRFNLPDLHAEILHRSVVGNKVVDHERITGIREQPIEAIAVYLVEDGLIQIVWLFNAE